MNLRRASVGLLLMLIPVIAVNLVKSTGWGPILAAPAARQQGPANAKITIVEYSDFQCPSCAFVQTKIHEILERYKGQIRFIYKYYPLVKIHKNALPAAHAAECAAAQKQFWPYHDKLFSTQPTWASLADPTTSFMAIASDVKLDLNQFNQCYADPSRRNVVEADAEEAKRRQVAATPTFFVNDRRLVGSVFVNDGARIIEEELRK
jgi:protein-disulfide isomerase